MDEFHVIKIGCNKEREYLNGYYCPDECSFEEFIIFGGCKDEAVVMVFREECYHSDSRAKQVCFTLQEAKDFMKSLEKAINIVEKLKHDGF